MDSKNKVYFVLGMLLYFCVLLIEPNTESRFIRFQDIPQTLQVEVADSPKEQETGLMHRKELGIDEGMLFIFETERKEGFWMKNVHIPLSIAFVNQDMEIVDIQEMLPCTSGGNCPIYYSKKPYQFAIETNKGWFRKNNIQIGTKIELLDKGK